MLDALIILMACNTDKVCVPFFVHEVRIERPEDCQQEVEPILEAFATKTPSDTMLRAICVEKPKAPKFERSA